MPSVDLATLRPDFALYIGFFERVVTTTAIVASTAVISTELPDLSYDYDKALNGAWVLIEGTANARVIRMVDSYTGSTGSSTVRGSNLVTESGAQKTVEFYPYSPKLMLSLLNTLRIENFPEFSLPRKYVIPTLRGNRSTFALPSGLFLGSPTEIRLRPLNTAASFARNLLTNDNPDFEVITGWAGTNMTTTEVVTPANEGDSAVPLRSGGNVGRGVTSGNSSAATVLNALNTNQGRLDGVEIGLEIAVYCLTSGRVKARIDEDTATTDSAFHNGCGWEILQVAREITTSPTTVSVGVVDTTNAAALRFYLARAIAVQGPIEIAEEMPAVHAPPWEYERPAGTTDTGLIRFRSPPPADMALEIIGKDNLSSLSAEVDTIEIDSQKASLLYALAAEKLAMEQLSLGRTKTRLVNWERLLNKAQFDIPRFKANFAKRAEETYSINIGFARQY
jgi:hypothetical protein